jgi:transcription elongation factor Elf1
MKKSPRKETEIPLFRERPFLCPHCNMMTAVETSVGYVDMKWVFCKHCGKQFVIRHDKPEKGC